MNAFHGIGAAGSASLATVAPGISEALIATAAGLAAAIPAVMAYNHFIVRLRGFRSEIEAFSLELLRWCERVARPSAVPVGEGR
jgi:biopolymer transport protein TolQ